MTTDGIFLVRGPDLVVLSEQPYATEDVLQRALAEYPEVIAGSTTAGPAAEAGRLLLVRREMGVPASEGGANVWSLDHLFLDGDGVPILVEVKRSSDPRIRREVVGQMLDYAANAMSYWSVPVLRAVIDQRALAEGTTADELMAGLRPQRDPEQFWASVEANLAAGRVRLLFVADSLPPELVRVIEFLNEQMSPAEVLGVELRQYVGGEHTVYVPQVVGRTSVAVTTKIGSTGQPWSEDTVLEAAHARRSRAEVALIQRLLEHAHARGTRLGWGKGVTPGVSGWYTVAGQPAPVWNLNVGADTPSAHAYLYFYLSDLARRLPAEQVEEAARTLETIPAMSAKISDARANRWNKYPSVFLVEVADSPAQCDTLLAAVDILVA